MTGRRKVSDEDIDDVRSLMERGSSTLSKEGVTYFRLLDSEDVADMELYHDILNDVDRYILHDSKTTWNKNMGSCLGMTIAIHYTDRHPELDELDSE